MAIGTALAVISAAASAASVVGAAINQRKQRKELERRRQELDFEYKYDKNLDFLNTPMSKSAISLLSQKYMENTKKLAQGQVITGAGPEKAVAAAEAMQKPFVNTISGLAGYGFQLQEAAKSRQFARDQSLWGLQYGLEQEMGKTWQNFGTNAANAAGTFSEASAAGAFDKWDENIAKRRALRELARSKRQ